MERLKLKEQLSKAKHLSSLGEMTAAISHEIRNPLGIIKSSAELLKKKMTTLEPGNRIPQIIVDEAGRLNNIITDFLNYAKPRDPKFIPCRVEEIIQKNIRFLEPHIQEQGYRICWDVPQDIPNIDADGEMLYQSFLNLLINAMQAMPEGGDIHIQLSQNENRMKIVFDDQGSGIPDHLKDKIWDPFFTNKEKGTGLGLGIVKKIIEAHNGTVQIDNSDEGGARVTIELPVRQEL
jgi:signal transduction histidine kinase